MFVVPICSSAATRHILPVNKDDCLECARCLKCFLLFTQRWLQLSFKPRHRWQNLEKLGPLNERNKHALIFCLLVCLFWTTHNHTLVYTRVKQRVRSVGVNCVCKCHRLWFTYWPVGWSVSWHRGDDAVVLKRCYWLNSNECTACNTDATSYWLLC